MQCPSTVLPIRAVHRQCTRSGGQHGVVTHAHDGNLPTRTTDFGNKMNLTRLTKTVQYILVVTMFCKQEHAEIQYFGHHGMRAQAPRAIEVDAASNLRCSSSEHAQPLFLRARCSASFRPVTPSRPAGSAASAATAYDVIAHAFAHARGQHMRPYKALQVIMGVAISTGNIPVPVYLLAS